MKKKIKNHISAFENKKFRKYTTIERKCMYSRAVLNNHPEYLYTKLNKIIRYKFGSGITKFDFLEIKKKMIVKKIKCPNCWAMVDRLYGDGCRNCIY